MPTKYDEATRAKAVRVGGRPTVVTTDKRAAILARHDRDESIRDIAASVAVSVGMVHWVITVGQARQTA
ncbi:hypothetical protein AAFP30_28495 [Gordonia sp. CPCC 205515]|uniref:hypothetical protein n=1 Tax=Gordonia sp. CPCC 205515 TaxID=3140791 RepID=UPI003AF3598B